MHEGCNLLSVKKCVYYLLNTKKIATAIMIELQIKMISRQLSLIGRDGWIPLTNRITKPNAKPRPPQIKPNLIKLTTKPPPPQINWL